MRRWCKAHRSGSSAQESVGATSSPWCGAAGDDRAACEHARSLAAPPAALDAYGYASDGAQSVERMAQSRAETLILHELGEARVATLLSPAWQDMRNALNDRRTELHVRAVRDLLADCLVTLPTLLERQADASVHFWFSNFEGLRAHHFPRLAKAYSAWCAGDGGHALHEALEQGAPHWQQVCEQVLALHHAHGDTAQPQFKQLLESPGCVL